MGAASPNLVGEIGVGGTFISVFIIAFIVPVIGFFILRWVYGLFKKN